MREMTRKALLETIAASSANLKVDTAAAIAYVCNDNTANPIVNLLPGFPTGTVKAVTAYPAIAEVTKVHLIGRTVEVIAAATRYAVSIGSNTKNYEGSAQLLSKYAYTSPTPLTTPAATALAQVNTALAAKINADTNTNDVTAHLVSKITVTGAAALAYATLLAAGFVKVGATIKQGTSWTGKVAYIDPTWAASASQVILVYDETGTYASGTAVTNSNDDAISTTAASTRVADQALAIIDNAGYFPANPHTRQGETAVITTGGFTTASSEVTRPAVYSQGVGSDMLKRVPIFAYGTQELVGNANGSGVGDATLQLNQLPVAGSFYRQVVIDVAHAPSDNVLTGYAGGEILRYNLWLKQDSITVNGTNNDALLASLVALI